jgi:hypothetical protein
MLAEAGALTLKETAHSPMTLTKRHLTPVAWIVLAAMTFALGWHLKPVNIIEPVRDQSHSTGTLLPTDKDLRRSDTERSQAATDANKRLTLTSERIAVLGDQLRRATDPIAKRQAFADLIAGLTAENALEIREQIAHLKDDDPDFRDFHYAWGQVAGLEAVLHGLETTDKKDMGPTLAGWASKDPAKAMEYYETLENKGNDGANKQAMKAALVHGLAIASPLKAADFVYALGESGDTRAKEMMGIVMGKVVQTEGAQQAAQWATNLGKGALRGHALWEAGRQGVRENADATLAWAGDLASSGDPNAGSLTYGVAQEMGGRDGAKVADWLSSMDGGAATSAYAPLLGGWVKNDPVAASEYVASMPPSESRDWAIGGMVHSHRWEDPTAAIVWANELSSAEGREKVMTLAAEAYVRKDPAAAAEWLPTSGLPIETQERLQAGREGK